MSEVRRIAAIAIAGAVLNEYGYDEDSRGRPVTVIAYEMLSQGTIKEWDTISYCAAKVAQRIEQTTKERVH